MALVKHSDAVEQSIRMFTESNHFLDSITPATLTIIKPEHKSRVKRFFDTIKLVLLRKNANIPYQKLEVVLPIYLAHFRKDKQISLILDYIEDIKNNTVKQNLHKYFKDKRLLDSAQSFYEHIESLNTRIKGQIGKLSGGDKKHIYDNASTTPKTYYTFIGFHNEDSPIDPTNKLYIYFTYKIEAKNKSAIDNLYTNSDTNNNRIRDNIDYFYNLILGAAKKYKYNLDELVEKFNSQALIDELNGVDVSDVEKNSGLDLKKYEAKTTPVNSKETTMNWLLEIKSILLKYIKLIQNNIINQITLSGDLYFFNIDNINKDEVKLIKNVYGPFPAEVEWNYEKNQLMDIVSTTLNCEPLLKFLAEIEFNSDKFFTDIKKSDSLFELNSGNCSFNKTINTINKEKVEHEFIIEEERKTSEVGENIYKETVQNETKRLLDLWNNTTSKDVKFMNNYKTLKSEIESQRKKIDGFMKENNHLFDKKRVRDEAKIESYYSELKKFKEKLKEFEENLKEFEENDPTTEAFKKNIESKAQAMSCAGEFCGGKKQVGGDGFYSLVILDNNTFFMTGDEKIHDKIKMDSTGVLIKPNTKYKFSSGTPNWYVNSKSVSLTFISGILRMDLGENKISSGFNDALEELIRNYNGIGDQRKKLLEKLNTHRNTLALEVARTENEKKENVENLAVLTFGCCILTGAYWFFKIATLAQQAYYVTISAILLGIVYMLKDTVTKILSPIISTVGSFFNKIAEFFNRRTSNALNLASKPQAVEIILDQLSVQARRGDVDAVEKIVTKLENINNFPDLHRILTIPDNTSTGGNSKRHTKKKNNKSNKSNKNSLRKNHRKTLRTGGKSRKIIGGFNSKFLFNEIFYAIICIMEIFVFPENYQITDYASISIAIGDIINNIKLPVEISKVTEL